MPIESFGQVWHNGRFVAWEQATLHVAAHAINYGSAVFDGFRCYPREGGTAAFRVRDHMERFLDSAGIYELPVPYSLDELCRAVEEFLLRNEIRECYLRPIGLRGYGESGMVPYRYPVEVYLVAWKLGPHLGEEALKQGADVCVSSWTRMAPNTVPAMAKVAGNYLNSMLIRMEAIRNGYAEGIALNVDGTVSEGSGETVFVVQKGKLYTPPLSSSILRGVTRDSVMMLATDMGIAVTEEAIPRELLYCADEVFLCGSAAEISPVRSVDRKTIGEGAPGPVTRALQNEFSDLVCGRREDRRGWLTVVDSALRKEK